MSDIILIDQKTGESYKVILYGEVLKLVCVEQSQNTDVILIDAITLIRYLLILDGGMLKLLEVR